MRTPREIYAQYKIMPNLQLHQLRVAAVGKLICDNFSSEGGSASGGKQSVNTNDVVLACLFHDMGNILKFDLTVFPESVQPEGIDYWERVKKEYRDTYGADQHAATLMIAKEIGLSQTTLDCIDVVAFSKTEATFASGSWEQKICEYADSRVSPGGVIPLDERLREARKRYEGRNIQPGISIVPAGEFEKIVAIQHAMELQIFSNASIQSEAITDAAVAPLIEELWEYPIA